MALLTGKQYADLIARYIVRNFGARGLLVYREVPLGKTIIGKDRQVDILVLEQPSNRVMAIECNHILAMTFQFWDVVLRGRASSDLRPAQGALEAAFLALRFFVAELLAAGFFISE